jgi:hypothetical protein
MTRNQAIVIHHKTNHIRFETFEEATDFTTVLAGIHTDINPIVSTDSNGWFEVELIGAGWSA